jgi:hypothetical protein
MRVDYGVRMRLTNFFGDVFRQELPPEPETVRQPLRKTYGNDAIVIALRQSDRPLSVTELAQAMGCCVGEASKRVKAAQRFLKIKKDGRRKLVSLKDLDRKQLLALLDTVSPGTYWGRGRI